MWQTPSSVIIHWRDNQLVAENCLLGATFAITPDILSILGMCSSPISTEDLVQQLQEAGYNTTVTELDSQLSELCTQGFLTDSQTANPLDILQEGATWTNWGLEAQYFHFGTKDAPYIGDLSEEEAYMAEISNVPQPPLFKRYPHAPRIPLPRSDQPPDRNCLTVLHERRTTRKLEQDALGLRDFAAVLYYSFAPQQFIDAGPFGVLPFRNYANAGARSEMEIYVNVTNVTGLDQGLYHYNVIEHSLEYLRETVSRDDLFYLTYEQPMCTDAPIGIFVTAVLDRMGFKYRHPRALRVVYYDVGHLGQTFALVATLYGFGPFQTAAFRDREVEKLLGLDGVNETALYYLGMGIAAKEQEITKPASLAAVHKTTFFQDVYLGGESEMFRLDPKDFSHVTGDFHSD